MGYREGAVCVSKDGVVQIHPLYDAVLIIKSESNDDDFTVELLKWYHAHCDPSCLHSAILSLYHIKDGECDQRAPSEMVSAILSPPTVYFYAVEPVKATWPDPHKSDLCVRPVSVILSMMYDCYLRYAVHTQGILYSLQCVGKLRVLCSVQHSGVASPLFFPSYKLYRKRKGLVCFSCDFNLLST